MYGRSRHLCEWRHLCGAPEHGVIPGPAEGRSPGTITTSLADQIMARAYWIPGSLASLGPRNDALRFAEYAVTYASAVIYEERRHLWARRHKAHADARVRC